MLSRQDIVREALEVGFDLCGVTTCRHLADNEHVFRRWLAEGHHAGLGYLERNLDKRFDVRRLVEGAQCVVVCAVAYKNPISKGYPEGFGAKIASYALSTDYHVTIKRMLFDLFGRLRGIVPSLAGRAFVDSAPLLEKQLAVEAGLGWIGRQSLLVTPQYGSFVLLGELVLSEPCDHYDVPLSGVGCGQCRRCIDNCPTHAIGEDHTIDARRCISCHTVERPSAAVVDHHGWIFGCDACQSCCPYNRRAPLHRSKAFDPLFDPLDYPPERWRQMTPDEFDETFATTPLQRTGVERLRGQVARQDED